MSGSLHTLGWSLLHAAAGMPARQRRRADVVLLAVLVAVVGAVAAFSVAAADAERVVGLWLGAEVSSDGSARITEVVDYQFGNARRHGIFRDVGGLRPDAPVAVWSATAPDRVALFGDERETRIRVGDSARTIDGTHRYLIRYPLRRFAPNGRVAWSMVGTGWRVKVDAVEFHMAAPFAFTRVRCVHPDGSPVACDVTQPEPGHLIGRISGLAAQ